jgi:signal transduction histidine kinase
MKSITYSILIFIFLMIFQISYAQEAKELIQKVQHTNNLNEKHKLYSDIGNIYFQTSDYKNALKYYLKAFEIAEKTREPYKIAASCNNIASVYNETENYDQSLVYSSKGLKYAEKAKDFGVLADLYGTKGTSHYQKYEDNIAIINYKKAIYFDSITNDLLSLGFRYRNLGAVYIENGPREKGFEYLKKSLIIYKQFGDTSRYFSNLVALSESYSKANQLDSAKRYIEKASPFLARFKNDFSRLDDYYYAFYEIYERKGDYLNALKSYKKHDAMNDSIVGIESNEKLHEMQVKYETVKKDNQIKTQNIKIEQDKKNQILLFLLIILLVVLFTAISIFIRKTHKTNLKLQDAIKNKLLVEKTFEAQENERTRIAKELHDGIVQDLTVLKMNLSSNDNKEVIEPKLSKITKELRELSYQMMPIALKELGLIPALEDLFFRSFTQKGIAFNFEAFLIEERLDEKIEVNIYRICQELINNSLKHANATEINIVLRKKDDILTLIFEDNGQGFDVLTVRNGIGLTSLKSRLDAINGQIEFDSAINKGTTAFIKINL